MDEDKLLPQRAILSVYDKTGIVELAQVLHTIGCQLISTGGTAAALQQAGLPVTEVAALTAYPEMLGGRVKTLHPAIHGGILAKRNDAVHQQEISALGITPIDLVVSNLYPFPLVVQRPEVTWEEAVENIDIGGPAMLRSAAKNHAHVAVLCDPSDYQELVKAIQEEKGISYLLRRQLAIKALEHTAYYDGVVSSWLRQTSAQGETIFPQELGLGLKHFQGLRYGENPHQQGALYSLPQPPVPSLLTARQLRGKELSYNNYNDANAALEILLEFTEPTVVAVKHANPCGVASAADIGTAFNLCYEADPVSIYGGIVAINRTIDAVCAEIIKPVYLDILMAPSFTPEALEILAGKSMIVLELGELPAKGSRSELQVRSIIGGLLLQERDTYPDDPATWSLQSQRAPSPKQLEDLLFAWKVVKHMRSNAIVVVKDKVTWGLGIGQVNRVDSTRIALQQAGGKSDGAVLASDGFFPFDDNISEAGKHGISCLVEPGGSIRDEECIATANSLDLVLLFTHIRHFKH